MDFDFTHQHQTFPTDDFFNHDSLQELSFNPQFQDDYSHISFSGADTQIQEGGLPLCTPILKKKIYKPKKYYRPETKNLTKFFGSRLNLFLLTRLIGADLELLKEIGCHSIKNLRTLWLRSPATRELSREYFDSAQPVLDVMHSDRISDHVCAIKYIKSFLRGIVDPHNFQKLTWDN